MVIPTMIYWEIPGKYHQTHVILTKKIYDLTGEPIFNEYHHLWKNYLKNSVEGLLLNRIKQNNLKSLLMQYAKS